MTALADPAVAAAPGATGLDPSRAACIGVLITVPGALAARLAPYRQRFVHSPHADVPAHITLLPPTLVPAARLGAVERHLRQAVAGADAFEVHLRGSGTFQPVSPVTFVQLAAGIGPCELLETRIRSGPLERPLDFPYHPHVTVAHNVDGTVLDRVDEDLSAFDARFEVRSVDLYQAALPGDGETPGPWTVRAEFRLGPPAAPPAPGGPPHRSPARHGR